MSALIIRFPNCYEIEKQYICSVIFNDFLGIEFELLFEENRKDIEIGMQGTNNSSIIFPEVLFSTPLEKWLHPSTLPSLPLRVRSLQDFPSNSFIQPSVPVLFGDSGPIECNLEERQTYFDIDLLGGIFFCLTLYEEVNATASDKHGRFPVKESILYKAGIYERPIVNEYVEILKELLRLKFNLLFKKPRKYKLVLSHDMDFSLTHETDFIHFLKSCLADLIFRRSPSLLRRRVCSRALKKESLENNPDPMNNADFIMDVSESLGVVSEFNFIVEQGIGTSDVRYDIEKKFYKDLLVRVRERGHVIGLHPSYHTYCDLNKTDKEFKKIRALCDELGIQQESWGGRHHYLRWKNPISWQIWDQMGADYDSSVGATEEMGFRAGTCYPYTVFDLIERKSLKLKERPLVVMDHSIFKIENKAEAHNKVIHLSKVCKHFGGELSLLYHNNYIVTTGQKRNYYELVKQLT
ncbi:polysaccharide deacetylase family protein [Solitalea lacus]|uniref:polysaccharide deacetylase family protein n=1 Tax=Solitalea lacus TaxID=2911172 RepID=UPI001EDA5CC0|nr:polysaccharide deacetylase family protein [Solitalea lacus]UKJ07229.1 polysaccharide deacetylase family protein [Solitalea lacus]